MITDAEWKLAVAAFNNVRPDQLPDQGPANEYMRKAWSRVFLAISKHLTGREEA